MSGKPLLSICIPTYNRANLLRNALKSIVPQASSLEDLVEVVVSDNCSSDHTPDVVREFVQAGCIKYHRNSENIGGGRNFLLLAQSLAQGEFCWIIGDNDLVYAGGVSAVVNALLNYPQADYTFVSSTFLYDFNQGDEISRLPRSCVQSGTTIVEKGERIIGFGADGIGFSATKNPLARFHNILWREAFFSPLFTYLGSHVIRTRLWREQKFGFTTDAEFPSMEATFPHAYTAVQAMVGKPSIYIGCPQIAVHIGAQDWTEYWPLIQTVRVLELADYIKRQGGEAKMVRL